MAETRGILVITDSDGAGFVIRNFLSGIVLPGTVKHAYIPELRGKEPRKEKASKEGLLGVKGCQRRCSLLPSRKQALAARKGRSREKSGGITKSDLYAVGLSGKEQSAERRRVLLSDLHLPQKLSANGLLDVLNFIMTREEFYQRVESLFGGIR